MPEARVNNEMQERTTLIPDREPLRWRIREVRSGELAAIEMELDRASLSFEWRFGSV
jgi:hypothetical protein